MKRILPVLLTITLLLCACQKQESSADIHLSWTFSNINMNGEFYTDSNGALHYFDFTSMKEAYVCSKPNCTHYASFTESSDCAALGMVNHPTIIGDSIWFFQVEMTFDNNRKPLSNTSLYKANLDGSGRIKVSTLEGYKFSHYDMAMVVGDDVYFTAIQAEFDLESYSETGFTTGTFFGCNLKTGKFIDYGKVFEGYYANALIDGVYKNAIYLSVSYMDEKVGLEMFDAEHFEELQKTYSRKYLKFDLETKTLEESDIPEPPKHIGEEYYVYMENADTIAIDSNGKKTVFKNLDCSDSSIVNGYLFTRFGERKAAELSMGKVYELNKNVLDESAEIIYYLDGRYITRSGNYYAGIGESELIGAEIA